MLIGEYVQQFEPGINDANNIANSALVQSREALDQAKNATAIANEALGQSRASVIELINSVNASTVTLIGNKNDGSQTTTNLPVASELQAGVMNTATYVNLKDLNSRVTSLESNTTTYIVVLPNATPTQAEILNAYRTAYPLAPNPPLDGTTVIDVDKQLFYRYVKNGDIWIKTSGFNVTPFTNENAGIIKGSTTPGQIQAETDGTGSLVGYDTLVSNIAQNTASIGTANGRIDAVETKNTEQDTTINNVSGVANHAIADISISPASTDVKINQTRGNGTTVNTSIPAVTSSLSGIVTPTMFNQWNAGKEEKYQTVIVKNTGNWYDGEYEGDAYPHPYANITLKDGTIIKFETSGTGKPGGGGGGPSARWRLIFNPEPTYNTFIIGTFRPLSNGEFSSPTSFSSISEWAPVTSKIITPRISVSQYGNHIHITIINLDTGLIVDELILSVLRSTEKISNYEYKRDVLFMSKNGITVTDFTV